MCFLFLAEGDDASVMLFFFLDEVIEFKTQSSNVTFKNSKSSVHCNAAPLRRVVRARC